MTRKFKRKPYYSRLGPFSWYRREWFALNLTVGDRIVVLATWKPGRFFSLMLGGRVRVRSRYGQPSSVEPWVNLWKSKRAHELCPDGGRWRLERGF